MNVTKRILIIDDEDQKNDIESIVRQLKSSAQVECVQIDVLKSDFFDEDANFKLEMFKQQLLETLNGHFYDLILVDISVQ